MLPVDHDTYRVGIKRQTGSGLENRKAARAKHDAVLGDLNGFGDRRSGWLRASLRDDSRTVAIDRNDLDVVDVIEAGAPRLGRNVELQIDDDVGVFRHGNHFSGAGRPVQPGRIDAQLCLPDDPAVIGKEAPRTQRPQDAG